MNSYAACPGGKKARNSGDFIEARALVHFAGMHTHALAEDQSRFPTDSADPNRQVSRG